MLLATAAAAAQSSRHTDRIVVAELVEAGPAPPHCGIVHFVVPMRYRVQRGALPRGAQIEVLVSCPELTTVHFTTGAVHQLTLVPHNPWRSGMVVPWPGHAPLATRWWARALRPG